MSNKLHIEVVSDVVCPWCYVGKRRLEAAMASRPDLEFEVTWQPFQLTPDMPREGRDRLEHYSQIFGAERARQIMDSMQDTGKEEGIAFATPEGARSPNTLAAHSLMLVARETPGIDSSELAERLFEAHHVTGEDIGAEAVLLRIAADVGMQTEGLPHRLTAAEHEVGALIDASVERGVSGVPFFIVNGRYGLSGAQPADSMAAVFDQVSKESEQA